MPNFTCERPLNQTQTPKTTDSRLQKACHWLAQIHPELSGQGICIDIKSIRPASSDASFRRYFRLDAEIKSQRGSVILMDAPPPQEDVRPFVAIAKMLREAHLNAPEVLYQDTNDGFLILSDLGSQTYLQALTPATASNLYKDAWRALIQMQTQCKGTELPPYNQERLLTEMNLFEDWYVKKHLRHNLTATQSDTLREALQKISSCCLAQTVVMVHRDYHSRNLMVTEKNNPGILDFQDAVMGPITYDLVSLLRDAYITWPEEEQLDWAIRYWQDAKVARLPVASDFADFWRDFEWMGLQRHLKVLGIFARLFYRDGKSAYLNDLPVVLKYAQDVSRRYVDLAPLARLLDSLHHA